VISEGSWQEIFNSDATQFGGSGIINYDPVTAENHQWHGKANSLILDLPPLGAVVLKKVAEKRK
jgi:1,4-alpha-glucan branching enzyme